MRYTGSSWVLRAVLVLVGVGFIYTGIDNAFGGIMTLGWQGLGGFAQATNPDQYVVRDSHVRFLGGVYLLSGRRQLCCWTNDRIIVRAVQTLRVFHSRTP